MKDLKDGLEICQNKELICPVCGKPAREDIKEGDNYFCWWPCWEAWIGEE